MDGNNVDGGMGGRIRAPKGRSLKGDIPVVGNGRKVKVRTYSFKVLRGRVSTVLGRWRD